MLTKSSISWMVHPCRTDWKHIWGFELPDVPVKYEVNGKTDYMELKVAPQTEGASTGSDFAGDVVRIGKNAEDKGVKVGDAVAGFVRASANPGNGAFQG